MTGDDEIVIQGDVKDDLFDVIPEKWPQVIYKFKMLQYLFLLSRVVKKYLQNFFRLMKTQLMI